MLRDRQFFYHFDLEMCFSPQRRAIFRHRNFKKRSETVSFFIGVAFCAVFEFQKSSHLQPLEWPQVAAFDAWPRYLNLRKSSHLQPLAATRVAASGRSSRVAASGREWPPLPHNVMNSKLRKTPTRSRRQPTYPSQLEKKHLSNKTYFFKMFEDYRQKA